MIPLTSLAKGAPLTTESWNDFATRLRHDCVGEGVREHCTADALFIVEAKVYDYGIDVDYGGQLQICDYDSGDEFATPNAYYVEASKAAQRKLDDTAKEAGYEKFLDAFDHVQLELIEDSGVDVNIVGRKERWEYVNSHFTRDAAEAFIARKKHDYRDGLRVYVEAQTHCWEFNAIKEAILAGKLIYVGL